MQFRIISDLHVDINKNYYSKFKFDPNAYYLIAGDISGDKHKTEQFLHYHMEQGGLKNALFVEGNHMGYDHDWNEADPTKEACYAYLEKQFPITSNIAFMENSFKEISDDIIVVGCTLYTNYLLYNNREVAMMASETFLNDFRYIYTYDNEGGFTKVSARSYEQKFQRSLQYIEQMCESNPTKKIIVLTHHAPSIQSISEKYKNDVVSASYASPLEDFILNHPNIKLWVHGHVHEPADYRIGECRVVCCPFGYRNENSISLTKPIGMEVYEL